MQWPALYRPPTVKVIKSVIWRFLLLVAGTRPATALRYKTGYCTEKHEKSKHLSLKDKCFY
jgi:hypothetical protein